MYSFTLTVQDEAGASASQAFTLSRPGFDGDFDEAAARCALARQLGPRWRGLEYASPQVRCLFAAFALLVPEPKRRLVARLKGLRWKRSQFCRGWLITGDTGTGKSTLARLLHQKFLDQGFISTLITNPHHTTPNAFLRTIAQEFGTERTDKSFKGMLDIFKTFLYAQAAENGNTVSALVISFKVQVALNPGDYKNQVKLTTSTVTEIDPGDPVALVIEPRPSLTLTAAAATGQVTTGSLATYIISVANVGSAVARGVAVSVSLAPGFLYSATTGYEGNSIRVTAVDPPASSLLPLWSSWDIPGASNGAPGLLRLTFQARILAGVVPGLYNLTAAVTSTRDVPAQTIGNTAPVAVGKGSRVPITMTVAPTAPYAAQNGTVTYVIVVENAATDAAQAVTVTDTLPQGFAYQSTNSIVINGKNAGSRLQPSAGSATPQWGPFVVPAGGFNGATLVITFTATINGAALGPHPNVVSGNSSNAQITGGSDQSPVIVTAG